MESKLNLDQLCAEYGFRFANEISKVKEFNAKKAETLLTKALSVLREQGLYAFVLFCESRGSLEITGARKIKEVSKDLLRDKLQLIGNGDLLEEIRKDNGIVSRLDDLMLAIQVLEKSLIYAIFHAKAMNESEG